MIRFLSTLAASAAAATLLWAVPSMHAHHDGVDSARSTAAEAGLIALAGPVRGRVRILYARNGGMVLLREISVPAGETVRELSLSADGRDVFVATEANGYAFCTRTGQLEAEVLARTDDRHAFTARGIRG